MLGLYTNPITAGLPLTLNAPVHRQNLERLEDIIALAEAESAQQALAFDYRRMARPVTVEA